jgi:hypothetical protein
MISTSTRTRSVTEIGRNRRAAVIRACLETLEHRRLLSFSPAVAYATGLTPSSIIIADLNGDTRPDLALTNSASSTVSVLLGNGNGTFQPALSFATGTAPRALAFGDFNADGKPDLVTANDTGLSILLNNGAGTFQAPANINIGNTPTSVAVGDFNADGKLDLAATSKFFQPGSFGYYGYYPGYFVSSATVLLGNGTGSFASAGTTGIGYGSFNSAVVADFNGDGKLDVAAVSPDNWSIVVLPGTGTGTLGFANVIGGGYASSLTAGDVNGDGKTDLVATSYSNAVNVMLGNGAGAFAASQSYATGQYPISTAIADFNGDGKADLITANAGDASASVLLGDGAGAFHPPINIATGSGAVSVAVGDFNADGKPDAATANSAANTASVLINNNAWLALDAPTISIGDVTVTEGNTGTVSASFTVNLSAASSQPITVQFATADGTATVAAGDYQAASGTISFAPGETSKTITVLVNGDRIAENGESFSVRLTDPANAFISDGAGVGAILDNEPRITIEYASVREGNTGTTPLNFTVHLSAASDVPVSVNFSTAEGDTDYWPWYGYYYYPAPPAATSGVDFEAKTGTLTFAAGETEKTITVQVNGDRLGEPNEVLSLNLTEATAGAVITAPHAVGTIIDDEAYVSITGGQIIEGNSGSAALTFTVTLSAASDQPVTVNYATSDGSATLAGNDYQAKSGTLTFAPGVTSQTFTVSVNGDRLAEQDEYFSANLSGATNAQITNGNAAGYITDNEPRISIASASVTEGNSGTKLMTFTVSLSAAYDQTVTVNFATADGSARVADGDYVARSGSLSFAPGETRKTFTITIRGDKKRESDEYFTVLLSGASSNALISSDTAWGSILNDEGGRGPKWNR